LRRAEQGAGAFDRVFAANHQALPEAGQLGVPTFMHEGGPFFGQYRLDQLLRRTDTEV